MKTQKEDWNGFQAKPPPLRRKAGMLTGRGFAEPVTSGPSRDQLLKWIGQRGHGASKRRRDDTQPPTSVPQRQSKRPCPVLTCASEKAYYKVKTDSIEKAKAIVVPSAHDLIKPGSSDLSADLLVTWLGVIAHGKTVHAREDKEITRFAAAARIDEAIVAFSPAFRIKHSRIVKEFQKVSGSSGSRWKVAAADAKNSVATPVSTADEFRQFLLKHLRKPRIAGLDWNLGSVEQRRCLMTRFGTPVRRRPVASTC